MLNALKLRGKIYAKSCSSEIVKGHEKDSAKIKQIKNNMQTVEM